MGVDTKPPDGSHSGRKYPRYDDLTSQWKRDDFVFIHKEIFDEMAKGIPTETSICDLIVHENLTVYESNLSD